MKFAICDDEPMHCAELENVFSRRNIDSEVYQSGEELLTDLEKNNDTMMRFLLIRTKTMTSLR